MSKYLVAFVNNTDETIKFHNAEYPANDQVLKPDAMFTTQVHFNIPDNSHSATYFAEHHMELQHEDGTPFFSFWDDDKNDYFISYCKGRDWENSTALLPGYNPAGNEINVCLVLSKEMGEFTLKSYSVLYNV